MQHTSSSLCCHLMWHSSSSQCCPLMWHTSSSQCCPLMWHTSSSQCCPLMWHTSSSQYFGIDMVYLIYFVIEICSSLIMLLLKPSFPFLRHKWSYLMFFWQVEFWLVKNLFLTFHRSRAVYFIRHIKSIIALTYCLCCVFHTTQKINNRSLWPFSKDTRIYVFLL